MECAEGQYLTVSSVHSIRALLTLNPSLNGAKACRHASSVFTHVQPRLFEFTEFT